MIEDTILTVQCDTRLICQGHAIMANKREAMAIAADIRESYDRFRPTSSNSRVAQDLIGQAIDLLEREASALSAKMERHTTQTKGKPMHMLIRYAFAIFVFLVPALALSQVELPASMPADVDTGTALSMFIASLGGMKGVTALGVALVIVQGVLLFFRTPLAGFAGKWRLVIVSGVAVVSGVLALVASGVPVLAALLHGTTFAGLQVFGNQFVKQFQKTD